MFGYALNPITSIWVISALATAGVIIRPFSWPEAIWAVLGGVALLALHLIGLDAVWTGVRKGTDVYLFLLGMMLLAALGARACSTGSQSWRQSAPPARRSACFFSSSVSARS
jgi:arsenical pump membrane protein